MANLLGQNIGTNYKGILNLNTLNGNLSGTLESVTDGDGNASPLQLSTGEVGISRTIALGAGSSNVRLINETYTINNSGAQTGTATGIFLNATETALNGMGHNLIDLQVGGVSRFRVSRTGLTTIGVQSGSVWNVVFDMTSGANPGGYMNWKLANDANSYYSQFMQAGDMNFATPGSGYNYGLNFSTSGVSRFRISPAGLIQFGGTTNAFPALKRSSSTLQVMLADDSDFAGLTCGAITTNSNILRTSRGRISWYGGDGIMTFTNSTETDFSRLNFGGITNAFPALKRNGAALEVRLADDSGFAGLSASTLTLNSNLNMASGTAINVGAQLRIGASSVSILSDSAATINFSAGASGRSWAVSTNTSGAASATAFLYVDGVGTGVTMGGNTANAASALLDMRSTTQGFLPPRGTNAQMLAIATPATGLVFYDTTNNKLNVYDGTNWVAMH